MRDNRLIICLILLALAGMIAIAWLFPAVDAYYHVQQGENVALGERLDISGTVGWQDANGDWNLAYYGRSGSEMDPQYTIKIKTKNQLYNFTISPDIFGQRLGPWYQFYGNESDDNHGNTLAFRVVAAKNDTPYYNVTNDTARTLPNQTAVPVPTPTILPQKHISDYLIARGDPLKIPVKAMTNAWIFGFRDHVYDYRSVNNTLSFTKEVISSLSAGRYTMILQTRRNGTEGFLVRYNKDLQQIEWFDSSTFKVNMYGISDKPPQEVLKKMKEIFPKTTDTFKEFTLEVEEPTISINQIDSAFVMNVTKQVEYVGLDNVAFLDVRGYTNHIPDTVIKVCVDPVFNVSGVDSWKDAFVTKPEGMIGDMRAWRITVPVEKYNMPSGRHFIGAKVESTGVITTADFYIYDNPDNSYVPNKTMRYISGRYGDQEIVPTPTPITIVNTVQVTVVKTITIPVTPPDEQVYAQQKIVQDEAWKAAEWKYGTMAVAGVFLIGAIVYGRSVYRRAKLK